MIRHAGSQPAKEAQRIALVRGSKRACQSLPESEEALRISTRRPSRFESPQLLPMREAKKERAEYEQQIKKEAGRTVTEDEPRQRVADNSLESQLITLKPFRAETSRVGLSLLRRMPLSVPLSDDHAQLETYHQGARRMVRPAPNANHVAGELSRFITAIGLRTPQTLS
jgi:hypothetical protein